MSRYSLYLEKKLKTGINMGLIKMSEESIISLKNVNKWFGDFHVLQDVNLEVKKGIVVCGPSGSGKSTMIRCINRLEEHKKVQLLLMELS